MPEEIKPNASGEAQPVYPKQTPETKMKKIIFEFANMQTSVEKCEDLKGKLTAHTASRLGRLVKVWQGKNINLDNIHLEYKTDAEFDTAMEKAHLEMIMLSKIKKDNPNGEKILEDWCKNIYEHYLKIIKIRTQLQEKELKDSIKKIEKKDTQSSFEDTSRLLNSLC